MFIPPFTLPISGKIVEWAPITVRQEMDTYAAHRSPERSHLVELMLIAVRVKAFDGKPTAGLGYKDIGEWDGDDYLALKEEILTVEAARKATLRRAKAGEPSPVAELQRCADELQNALTRASKAMLDVVEAAKAAELSGPLARLPNP